MSLRAKTSTCTYISLLLLASTTTLLAQTNESAEGKENRYFSINIGAGIGPNLSPYQGRTLAYGISSSFQFGHVMITPRYAGVTEALNMTGFLTRSVHDAGVTIGYSTRTPGSSGYLSIAAGIGYVGGREDYDTYISTIGFPIDVQLFFTPSSFVGIGFQGIANINPERSFYGVLLCLQLGKLR